jgi:hypothetical protein
MPIEARKQYLIAIIERYKKATRRQKSVILTEFCEVCGYNRKYAILILNSNQDPKLKKSKPGRPSKYDEAFIDCLKEIWEATGQICSKKMVAAIPLWIGFFDFKEAQRNLLLTVSSSSIDRLLRGYRSPKGKSATRPSMFRHKVPIELISGYVTEPGHLEADTVAHCGNSLYGDFINTLTLTDLATGWTENRALWGKTGVAVVAALKDIEQGLPFFMKGFASDNGSEFLNAELESYLTKRNRQVKWTRRRPYKKNDAAHVEQKNWTHVRELFGYDRFDNIYLRLQMDQIYKEYWNVLQNFFIPVFKLESKDRIGGKIKKVYDTPQTPYQRLIKSGHLGEDQVYNLKKKMESLNPVQIKQEMEIKLREFWQTAEKNRVRMNYINDASKPSSNS